MIFEQVATGGCQSYLVGCPDTLSAILIDPEISQIDRYRALAGRDGLHIRYVVDTHTHADHFSAARQLAAQLDAPLVMHHESASPHASLRLDDDDMLLVGNLRIRALHTPGHTRDSMCLVTEDRVFTGDTLLIGATGRTDLPTGDPDMLYDSLFGKLLTLDPALKVFPAHDYKGRSHSTLAAEIADNPRLQKRERADFTRMMRELNLAAPTHLTEALRTNMSGGKTVSQMLSEAAAEAPFMAMADLARRLPGRPNDLLVLDVREAGFALEAST
jgi:glyoxylase-like metal-dependent hydrolase (beta-lactamase superfamily II)